MSYKENETQFLNFTRDDFVEHILILETKLGKQRQRNEALFAELQRTEWKLTKEVRELRIALRQAGGNSNMSKSNSSRRKANNKSSKKDQPYETPNVVALKNEIRVLKATVRTYYDEVKRLQTESNNKNIDYLMGEDDNEKSNKAHAATTTNGRRKNNNKKKKENGTFEERMRAKTNKLAKRAEKRKERERVLMEEKQAKQMQKIIRNKAKKQRAIEKIKAREEAEYQKRRDDTIKLIHEQFERDLRLENEMAHDEQTINEIEKYRDEKIKEEKNRKRRGNNFKKTKRNDNGEETIPMEDILSRLNDNMLFDGDESLSD